MIHIREYVGASKNDVRCFYDRKVRENGQRLFLSPDEELGLYLLWDRQWKWMLDAGCGTGWLLKRVRCLGRRGIGIDLSREMVGVCCGQELDVLVGDIEDIQFKDGAFDLVTCLGSLEHTIDPGRGLRELCRVSSRWVVLELPLWYEDAEGPISRYYMEEGMLNIERWLLPEEWDKYILGVDGLGVELRKVIHSGRDILYVLEKS